jgi:CubicO group peptidase (beta-lactamase class C family)
MLPEVMAVRMKQGETIADRHEATVLFADIKGFTAMARHRSAEEVVELLDKIFRRLDTLARQRISDAPGTTCLFADAGFNLSGRGIENVTGKSFPDVLKDRLLQPLGMESQGFLRFETLREMTVVRIATEWSGIGIVALGNQQDWPRFQLVERIRNAVANATTTLCTP